MCIRDRNHTHRVYPQHPDWIDPDYILPPYPLANTRENREDMANYHYSVSIADECVGIVLDALQRSGKAQDTICLLYTSRCV